jgi:hypothetical protein
MIDAQYHEFMMAAARAETAEEIGGIAARLLREVPADDPDREAVGEALATYRALLGSDVEREADRP